MEKIAAPSPTDAGRWLFSQVDGLCPTHGTPMHYRDLEQQEAYCPYDEVKEKRATAGVGESLLVRSELFRNSVQARLQSAKASLKTTPSLLGKLKVIRLQGAMEAAKAHREHPTASKVMMGQNSAGYGL